MKNSRRVTRSVSAARSRRLNLGERQQQILQIMSFPSWADDLVSIQHTQAPGRERMRKDQQQWHWWNRVVHTEWKHRAEEKEGLVGTWRLLRSFIPDFPANHCSSSKGCGKHFDTAKVSKTKFKVFFVCHFIGVFLGCQWIHSDWVRIGTELTQPLGMSSPWLLSLVLGRNRDLGLKQTNLAHHN